LNYYIGLLSGTSVDGIDAALVAIDNNSIRLIGTYEQGFSQEMQSTLQTIIKSQEINLRLLSDIDAKLADEFSYAVENLLLKTKITKQDVIAIGSHGQTIFHQPLGDYKNTLQIGSPHRLAAKTGLTVIANFRNLDMAYGGQGAPLAPLIHSKLFIENNKNTAVINLGGITNISFIGKDYKQLIGYDIGPANCLIDEWTSIHLQKPYDKNGTWARQGLLNKILLNEMLNDDYFKLPYPKSTGREYFNLNWLKNFKEEINTTSENDIQTTLTHLIAASISQSIKQQNHSIEQIIVMGGGAKNSFIKELISEYTKIPTVSSNSYGFDPQWIEAILFAYMAYKRINHQKLDLSSFTGSTQAILVGDIIEPTQ
jgi:anhydro-N-acetylmuramic acid kinase